MYIIIMWCSHTFTILCILCMVEEEGVYCTSEIRVLAVNVTYKDFRVCVGGGRGGGGGEERVGMYLGCQFPWSLYCLSSEVRKDLGMY